MSEGVVGYITTVLFRLRGFALIGLFITTFTALHFLMDYGDTHDSGDLKKAKTSATVFVVCLVLWIFLP